jgi:glycyl-tRNA synthetase beta chain
MQNKILLELFFKNLTVDLVRNINNKLLCVFKKFINFQNLDRGLEIDNLFTPERIVIKLSFSEQIVYTYKGVRINEKKERLDFFMQKVGIDNCKNLEIIDDIYYYRKIVKSGDFILNMQQNIGTCLENVFIDLIIKVNPLLNLSNIVFFINKKQEEIVFNNIVSNNRVKINNDYFKIKSVDEYFEIVKNNKIFFETYNRKEYLSQVLSQIDCDLEDKKQFIENVLDVKEKPLFLIGRIKFNRDKLFVKILYRFLRINYLFFKKDDYLYFIFLDDNGREVIDLNAQFSENFTKQHVNKIEKAILKINNIIEVSNLGKQNKEYEYIFNENKMTRLEKLTKFISLWIPLCKVDNLREILSSFIFRTSNLLNNNLELTLLFKKYILLKNNRERELVELIIDCFRPFGRSKDLPQFPLSNAVAIANKIDNIVYIAILKELNYKVNREDEKRNYNDLIGIILNNQINLPLKMIIDYSVKNFLNEIVKKKQNSNFFKKYKIDKNSISEFIIENIYTKLYFYLIRSEKNNNILLNILINLEIKNIYDNKKSKCHLLEDCKKITDLYKFFSGNDGDLIKTYKRLNNLLSKYKNIYKNKQNISAVFQCENKEEEYLYRAYFAIKKEIEHNLSNKNYYQCMISLEKFNNIIGDFLDKIFIEKSNFFKKQKRLKLLFSIKYLFDGVADFEKLITKL